MKHITTYAELLQVLQDLPPTQLGSPIRLRLADSNGQAIASLALTTSLAPAIPSRSDIAIQICELLSIRMLRFYDNPDQWLWTEQSSNTAGEGEFDSRESAAVNAVEHKYPRLDWQFEIDSGNTSQGYFDWALQKAQSDADDLLHA